MYNLSLSTKSFAASRMDKLPKKITPNRLKDSVVEVRYYSKFNLDILLGVFYNKLADHFQVEKPQVAKGPEEQLKGLNLKPIFYNDVIKISFKDNSIIFNILSDYPGWDEYFSQVRNALSLILEIEQIEYFNRVGVRYISQYEDLDLLNLVKFHLDYGIPEVKSDSFIFRTEFNYKEVSVLLSILNRITMDRMTEKGQWESQRVSQIDVDAIQDGFEIVEQEKLLAVIEHGHQVQKEIFFKNLKKDFLESLNPEY